MSLPDVPDISMMGSPEGAYVVPVDLDPQPNPLGDYPLDPEMATLEPNAFLCLDCARLERGRVNACPVGAGMHTVEVLHVSEQGLGYANDDWFFNWDRQLFEYPAMARVETPGEE